MTRALLPTCLRASAPVDMRATHPLALRLRRYGVAVVATGSALLFHYGLDAIMDQRALFLKVALAVLVSAWYGGLGPGLFATGLGALAALFMFFPPYYRLTLPVQEDGIALAVLVCAGGVISLLVAQLRQARQRAEHFALLGRLAASVSHDIRNPLGAIVLHVDLLEDACQEPGPTSRADMAAAIAEIRTQIAYLDDLVQDYLSLTRVAHLTRTPQDLGAAVHEWATAMQRSAAARGVALHLEGLETVGQVAFHASMLRRVILNLIQNALEATPPGGTVTLAGHGTATQVQLHVRDTGGGMPAAQLRHIFEPFYTTKAGGTGLGLSITQEIVTAHGGQLTVHSVAGQGTTFTITLPRGAVVRAV